MRESSCRHRRGTLQNESRIGDLLLWFKNRFDDSVREFKLLRGAGGEEVIDTSPYISRILFAFQNEQDIRLESQSVRHCDDGVEAWHFFPTLDVTPEIAGDVPSFGSFLKAEFCRLPQLSDSFCK